MRMNTARAAEISRKVKKLVYAVRKRHLGHVFHHRLSAAVEHRHLSTLPVNLVIDVGANRGQFSLLMRDLFPAAQIHAFEPLPGPADVYETCLAQKEGVRLTRAALSDASGEQLMHVSESDDSSSLLPIGKMQQAMFPGTSLSHTLAIKVETLDHHYGRSIETPPGTLLKIDTQGSELAVLRGAVATLQGIDWVYVEASYVELYQGQDFAWQVIQNLHDAGFRLCGVYNTSTTVDGIAIQSDLLFSSLA